MVPEIDVQAFAAAHADGALVIDVREPSEYATGHVPGAQLVPLSQVPSRSSDLPKDKRIHVICASGNRSKTAASWLITAGHDAISVAGGTGSWISQGRPVVPGLHADAA